jgi:hypothetical protein
MREKARAARSGTFFGPAGYVASVIGSLGGAVALGVTGVGLGFAYADRFMPEAGLDQFTPVVVGLVAGATVGAGLGSWAGVALARQSQPAQTGALTALIAPPIPLVVHHLSDTLESQQQQIGLWLGGIAVAAVLARAITARLARASARAHGAPALLWLISVVEIFLVIRAVVFR